MVMVMMVRHRKPHLFMHCAFDISRKKSVGGQCCMGCIDERAPHEHARDA